MALGRFLTAPLRHIAKATKATHKAAFGAGKAALTGHPMRAAKAAVGVGPSNKLKKKILGAKPVGRMTGG